MKYGIIVFKNTENIGDDIQSYAAAKLLPKIDYFIEREAMDLFIPEKEESVITIMNGWFLHQKTSFPPSPYINPIFISSHFSNYNTFSLSDEHIKLNKDYLNFHGPIGCRDFSTKKLLDEHSINNYFSGCLTLTIDCSWDKPQTENMICCVDIDEEILGFLEKNRKEKLVKETHVLNYKTNSQLSWDERFKNVENLFKKYQKAKLVITSRLHCALPCLALGINVLFINKEKEKYFDDRINDFLPYLNHCSKSELLENGIDSFMNKKNPDKFKEIRDSLKNKLNIEIKNKNNEHFKVPSIINYKTLYVDYKLKLNELYSKISNDYKKTFEKNMDINNENKFLKKELQNTKKYWEKEFCNLEKNKNNEIRDLETRKNKELKDSISYWEKEFRNLEKNKNNEIRDLETRKNRELKDLETRKNRELKDSISYWKGEFEALEIKRQNEVQAILDKNQELYSILDEHELEFKKLNEKIWKYEELMNLYGSRKLKKLVNELEKESSK